MDPARLVSFTANGMRRGIIAAQPLALGVFVYGIAFGLLAREVQLSLSEALIMSGVIYSGSAQLVVVNGMSNGAIPAGSAVLAILATLLLLNARYVLYGAALRPWLGRLPAWKAYPTLAVLGDGNWILSMKAYHEGERDAGFVFATGIGMFIPWLGGTWIGSAARSLVSSPTSLGLDFMLVAFSAAMAVGMFRGRSDLKIVAAAVLVSLVVHPFAPGGSTILAAGLAGGAMRWLTFDEKAQAKEGAET